MISIFNEIGLAALDRYLLRMMKARNLAISAVQYYAGSADQRADLRAGQELEHHWYTSLAAGVPDYGVYDNEYFIGEIWSCWIIYSRRLLE
jgi:hypothetical protein